MKKFLLALMAVAMVGCAANQSAPTVDISQISVQEALVARAEALRQIGAGQEGLFEQAEEYVKCETGEEERALKVARMTAIGRLRTSGIQKEADRGQQEGECFSTRPEIQAEAYVPPYACVRVKNACEMER